MKSKYPESSISNEEYSEIETIFRGSIKDGLPQFDSYNWKVINTTYDKAIIREALIIFILENKCPFPYKNIHKNEVVTLFNALKGKPFMDFIKIARMHKIENFELNAMYKFKFEEEDHKFEDEGTLIISSGHQYNRGSDYFQQENRYSCGTWQKESPIKSWNSWKGLKSILGVLWRMDKTILDLNKYIAGVRLGLYNATQFKPPVAKTLYELFSSKIVFDISCGWGDRLFGFYTSNATEYYGCDPNPDTYQKYIEQCEVYENVLGGSAKVKKYKDHFILDGVKKIQIWNLPAEDLDYNQMPELDCVFSSPPYFSTEKYSEDNCEDQSWFRYNTPEKWQTNFLHAVLEKCSSRLKDDGIIAVNIIDGSVKGIRQHICSPMIKYVDNSLNITYKGMIGMEMNQRPNTSIQKLIDKKDNESNTEFTKRVADLEKKIVSSVPFIEPIFIFTNKDIEINETLLNKNNIEDLFE